MRPAFHAPFTSSTSSARAISAVHESDRARLPANLRGKQGLGDLAAEQAELGQLTARVDASAALDDSGRLELYRQIRTLNRQLALQNPLVTSQPVLFMEHRRAVGCLLYEDLG